MKILVYETNEIAPFGGLYAQLGQNKFIFSNAEQEIQHFDSEEVNTLLKAINFDTIIFYIPSSIQAEFLQLIEQEFQITGWQKENTVKFSDDIKLIGNQALSSFLKTMKLILGLTPKKECSKELIDAIDNIFSKNNIIEAIFVYDLVDRVIPCQIERPGKQGILWKYNLYSIAKSFELLKNSGLNEQIMEFDDGIVICYLVKNSSNSPKAIIGFITTAQDYGILGQFVTVTKLHFKTLKNKCC